jgi:hypothetical protein
MSHITGTVQTVAPAITIGPDTGAPPTMPNTWLLSFAHAPAPTGTKLLMLHFQNASLPASNRLEVDLGYDTDVFTSADGADFWTRPINVYVLPGGLVPIRYITNGAGTGSVQLDRYGRGEGHAGEPGHPSFSNSDPFLKDPAYTEPTYDPFWYCAEPPNWENVACVPPDLRTQLARSVGMIITIHGDHVSTCSVTLVDADKVITAGHCHTPSEALTGSVTFDYQTVDCDGNRPPGYNARFHKVTAVLNHRWTWGAGAGGTGRYDYALLQLATSPPGIPVIQLRHDIPAAGEQVFGVHHPNGAVKKLSIPHPGFSTVLGSGPLSVSVPSDFHVSGGSSGSGLFDLAGRIVGVLSNGDPCGKSGPAYPLLYFPTATFLLDVAPAPPPPVTRDVMVVFDRSGSMSMDDGTGRTKIEAARDAVSLFVQLVQAGTGNRAGLVSFATTASSPADFNIAAVTNGTKNSLIGPAPYSGGIVGGLAPGGLTSIGGGLEAGRLQFPAPGANPRAILLLTDGLQNTPPMVGEVEDALGGIAVHAIGYGTEASLDGELLTALAAEHDGLYTRAGYGLALEKFFTEAFGNIFEAGLLFDPEFDLPANQSGAPIPFAVCGEDAITAVVGWDRADATLFLEITSPGGAVITTFTAGVEAATGKTWGFLRLKLPHGGERDGLWKVRVVRPSGSGEFPPPSPALRYFLSVVPTGGPRFLRAGESRRRYYTGDFINPLVMLRYDDGGWPHQADVHLTLSRPDRGTGNILTAAGLGAPAAQDGDTLPARYATLQAIETTSGQPVVKYVENSFTLTADSIGTGGFFEAGGIFGKPMPEQLTVEGNYTFHARATYGEACQGARELAWTFSAAVGIDSGRTDVSSNPLGTRPDGTECLRLTFTPRDRYGNYLGPGRTGAFEVQPQAGTTVTSGVQDLGNGSYQVDLCWDPASGEPPRVGLAQPERPPVVVTVPDARLYVYSVKFLCGVQAECDCHCGPLRPGAYATEINIHNPLNAEAVVAKHVIPLVFAGAAAGREPRFATRKASDRIVLPAHAATMDDCCRLAELLLGAPAGADLPLTTGFLEIVSNRPISVTAVYTVSDPKSGSVSIDVEQIEGRLLRPERAAPSPPEKPPDRPPSGHPH